MKRIYISDMVHEQLKREAKREGRTLQWVVEQKLTGNVSAEIAPPEKTEAVETPYMRLGGTPPSDNVSDLIQQTKDNVDKPLEMDCCQHPSYPCKHWVWDVESGEGYKNTLSGRYREAE